FIDRRCRWQAALCGPREAISRQGGPMKLARFPRESDSAYRWRVRQFNEAQEPKPTRHRPRPEGFSFTAEGVLLLFREDVALHHGKFAAAGRASRGSNFLVSIARALRGNR